MANLIIQFAISYIIGRLTEPKAPRLGDLTGFKADYGGAISLILGPEVRATDGTVIWATKIRETVHKHKPGADYLFGVAGALLPKRKTYTYDISLAVLLCGNRIRRVVKIWMNSKLVFDAGASTSLTWPRSPNIFKGLRVYQGTFAQTPDPTIEADKGMGNVPAYLGSAYVVIDGLALEPYGNSVPGNMEFLVEESVGPATLSRVIEVMVAASGINTATVSTTGLSRTVRGFVVDSITTVADAFTPLIQAFQFDGADQGGQLRFIRRGRYPKSTVTADQMGGHEGGQERPELVRWSRAPETAQPREVTVNFVDPERDYQPSSQGSQRQAGSAQSNISVNTGLTLSADEAQRAADEILWESWAGRQVGTTSTDETRNDIQAAEVHAFETPNGVDTFRVMRRSRGANGVINLELRADRPLIYGDDLPGIPAPIAPAEVVLPGTLNDPIFIEPPSTLAHGELWIALSAQLTGGGVDPNFGGVQVYVATANVEADYRTAGASDAAAYMGELTADLAAYGGAPPDGVDTLSVDLSMSGGVLASVNPGDAASGAVNLYFVDGELMTAENATATGPNLYDADTLYRGLFGTVDAAHLAGAPFAVVDDAIFRFAIPVDMIGQALWFKFLQVGQVLSEATAYSYTPVGTGYGGGAGGVPLAPSGVTVTPSTGFTAVVTWTPNVASDNVTTYDVYRAPGLGAAFGDAATKVGDGVAGNTWTDTSLTPDAPYTWFVVAHNVVGAGAASAGTDYTSTPSGLKWGFGFDKELSAMVGGFAFCEFVSEIAWTIPAGMAECAVQNTDAAPTVQTDWLLKTLGVTIGTIRFAIGSNVATFIKAADSFIPANQPVQIVAPASGNGMTGRLYGSIVGGR